jgi:crotonobetainyl-CoA:carnitine CoA-transferase CaiB-like acyl-CoA transferase
VPFQNFRTSDGWIVVCCAKEKFWRRLVEVLDHPALEDPRYATFATRHEHREELLGVLAGVFGTRTTAEWLDVLGPAGIPCGPVNTVEQAMAEPLTAARGMVVETEHPRFGGVRAPASPVKVGPPEGEHRRAPARNEDADELLRGLLGYPAGRIAELQRGGAFGEQGGAGAGPPTEET